MSAPRRRCRRPPRGHESSNQVTESLIQLQGVNKRYGHGATELLALKSIDLEI